jgi:hypothetical protein
MNQQRPPRFYFALPRLLAKMRGGDSIRAEQNSIEAWAANLAIYLISYLYFAGFIPALDRWWLRSLILVALAFLVWLFWLLVLFVNSLILRLLGSCGLLRWLPIRRGQAVLIAIIATAMAAALLQRGALAAEFGAIWLVATAMNLLAATILAFTNGEPARP